MSKKTIKLSGYLSANEKKWNDAEDAKVQKLMTYLEEHIDANLCEVAKTSDKVEAFRILEGWLFNFYPAQFLDGLANIGYDYLEYQKKMILSFILAITRDRPNVGILYNMLAAKRIITNVLTHEESEYKIATKEFGDIPFKKANEFIDEETVAYLKSLGEQRVVDGCHEISFFLIKKDPSLRAVTSTCVKGLGNNFYHSFVLDKNDEVIDLTANLIMPKKQYYFLHDVQELNIANYKEYLSEKDQSVEFDESKTLFGLLRNALYKQAAGETEDDA